MIDAAIAWFVAFDFTSQMGLLLYWLPLVLCAIGYVFRTIIKYQECCELRAEGKTFYSDTIGVLIGRFILTVVPVLNLFALVFSVMGGYFKVLAHILDVPLVRQAAKK
jgi:uncharacterized membrane protein HdeD (DUF308 family)